MCLNTCILVACQKLPFVWNVHISSSMASSAINIIISLLLDEKSCSLFLCDHFHFARDLPSWRNIWWLISPVWINNNSSILLPFKSVSLKSNSLFFRALLSLCLHTCTFNIQCFCVYWPPYSSTNVRDQYKCRFVRSSQESGANSVCHKTETRWIGDGWGTSGLSSHTSNDGKINQENVCEFPQNDEYYYSSFKTR
jgi:hypothetical protein